MRRHPIRRRRRSVAERQHKFDFVSLALSRLFVHSPGCRIWHIIRAEYLLLWSFAYYLYLRYFSAPIKIFQTSVCVVCAWTRGVRPNTSYDHTICRNTKEIPTPHMCAKRARSAICTQTHALIMSVMRVCLEAVCAFSCSAYAHENSQIQTIYDTTLLARHTRQLINNRQHRRAKI